MIEIYNIHASIKIMIEWYDFNINEVSSRNIRAFITLAIT